MTSLVIISSYFLAGAQTSLSTPALPPRHLSQRGEGIPIQKIDAETPVSSDIRIYPSPETIYRDGRRTLSTRGGMELNRESTREEAVVLAWAFSEEGAAPKPEAAMAAEERAPEAAGGPEARREQISDGPSDESRPDAEAVSALSVAPPRPGGAPPQAEVAKPVEERTPEPPPVQAEPSEEPARQEVLSPATGGGAVATAMKYLGAPYVWAGSSPSGFDCSGFVQYVYRMIGISLPRDIVGMIRLGQSVPRDSLQPGDVIVFQNTSARGLSHVGICLGESRFIHSVSERRGVSIDTLNDAFWAAHYHSAIRF